MSSELSIAIVNWNGGALLQRCLESIARNPPGLAYEVIVVDNASSDGSAAFARAAGHQLIENGENLGFAIANNQAFARSRSPFVLLLNPDAELLPGAIDALMETLRAHPRAGACGPRLLNEDGTLQPSVWRNPPAAWHILVTGLGLWRLIPRALRGRLLFGDHWAHDEPRAVPMVFAAAMLVRRETIDGIGGFDERFPLYAEDDEWCLRMRRGGWSIRFEPRATVMHRGSGSALQRWDELEKLRAKQEAYALFQRISLSAPRRIANLLAGCIVNAFQVLRRPSAHAPRVVLKAQAKALVQELRR